MGFVRISGAMRQVVSCLVGCSVHRCGSSGDINIHLAPDMHNFLIMRWILFDAIGHHAIERRVNVNECTVLVKTLENLVLARFEQPQKSFRLLLYALDLFIHCWFSCHKKYLHTSMVL